MSLRHDRLNGSNPRNQGLWKSVGPPSCPICNTSHKQKPMQNHPLLPKENLAFQLQWKGCDRIPPFNPQTFINRLVHGRAMDQVLS